MIRFFAETASPNPYSQWVVIALTLGTLIYVALIRPAMNKKKDPLAKQPSFSSLSQQRNVDRQMQNLLVELSEMARQISAQLDTRSLKLETLIQDADERIGLLKQLVNADRPGDAGTEQALLPQRVNPPQSMQAAAMHPPASYTPAFPHGWSDSSITPTMTRNIPIPEPMDDQHQPVYALADQGRSAGEIARELNRPRGEVELILALRPAGQRT